MCGRYASFLPAEALAAIFGVSAALPNFPPSWNVAPTQQRPVIRRHPDAGDRRLDLLTWGLVPHFTKDLKAARKPINARAETVASSGMFRGALAQRRCLVPADVFYEWRPMPDGKQPYAIAWQDGQPMAFAGLWEGWRAPDGEVLRTYTIITTAANATMAQLHHRMPVILEPADWATWLGEDGGDPMSALRPADNDVVRLWPVSRAVNSVRNDVADLLNAIDDPHPHRLAMRRRGRTRHDYGSGSNRAGPVHCRCRALQANWALRQPGTSEPSRGKHCVMKSPRTRTAPPSAPQKCAALHHRLGSALFAALQLVDAGNPRQTGLIIPRGTVRPYGQCKPHLLRLLALAAYPVLVMPAFAAPEPGNTFVDCELGCPAMVVIGAGRFLMGSGLYAREQPQHIVTFQTGFAVSKFDITFDDWSVCASSSGCAANPDPPDEGWGRGRHPVINVSWDDAKAYVSWLSKRTGHDYRLLTEAEWEYAARAGSATNYAWGDAIDCRKASYDGGPGSPCPAATGRHSVRGTQQVGRFPPNGWGLYDMLGNVWQWCEDDWHPDYRDAPADGSAWTSSEGKMGVLRGGAWNYRASGLRSADRNWLPRTARTDFLGFRVARSLETSIVNLDIGNLPDAEMAEVSANPRKVTLPTTAGSFPFGR